MRTKTKRDYNQEVTDRIIRALEEGTVPWRNPVRFGGAPRNLTSERPYRGINVFLLGLQGFSSPYWTTYKQAEKLGGTVKKGEKGSGIVFWNFTEKERTRADGSTVKDKRAFLRHFTVFNLTQCEGIPEDKIPAAKPIDFQPEEAAEAVIREYLGNRGPGLVTVPGYAIPCYRPATDTVEMPPAGDFESGPRYYSVGFHELGHSTGHASRLRREGIVDPIQFASHRYSKEELVAEMTACFLMNHCGMEADDTIEQSAAYIGSWLQKLQNDPKLVISAASAAQKATDYILGTTFDNRPEDSD
jgi:antirestriction protein ArdC